MGYSLAAPRRERRADAVAMLEAAELQVQRELAVRQVPAEDVPATVCAASAPRATSSLGLCSPLRQLRRDWSHRVHICTGTGLK